MTYRHPNKTIGPLPRDFGGVLNFHLITNPEDFGFWPWSEVLPAAFDPATHKAVPRETEDPASRTAKRVWDIVALSEEEIEAAKPQPPDSVSPLQMRKALRAAGLKPAVDVYLATLDEEAQEAWQFCVEVRQDDPFILDAVTALGFTPTQKADLFLSAGTF